MKNKILTTTALALCFAASGAMADTVHTMTYTQPVDVKNVNQIRFSDFDMNNDGFYSKAEVGEKLFYVFDRDGNHVIDNQEWDQRSMYTIMPMEKQTFKYIDLDGDGETDMSSYRLETFYEESGLIRFDKNKDGLSASEFIASGYLELDDNDNNLIEIDEWKEAYTVMLTHENAENERYN